MLFVDQIRTLFLIESQEYFWKWERKEEEFDPSLNITRKSCLLLRHCCSLRFTTASRVTVQYIGQLLCTQPHWKLLKPHCKSKLFGSETTFTCNWMVLLRKWDEDPVNTYLKSFMELC